MTKIARVVQYRRRRETGLVSFSARVYCSVCDGVTGTPASCRRWLNPLARPGQVDLEVDDLELGDRVPLPFAVSAVALDFSATTAPR